MLFATIRTDRVPARRVSRCVHGCTCTADNAVDRLHPVKPGGRHYHPANPHSARSILGSEAQCHAHYQVHAVVSPTTYVLHYNSRTGPVPAADLFVPITPNSDSSPVPHIGRHGYTVKVPYNQTRGISIDSTT